MKRALITGIGGMDGSHLVDFLLERDYEIFGTSRTQSNNSNIFVGDLTNQEFVNQCIVDSNPNEVYNLAAPSIANDSELNPVEATNVIGMGVLRILESIRKINNKIKFFQASSSEMFGNIMEFPQNETTSFYPRNPYGVAKLYGHWITKNYRELHGLFSCSGILFNHESERRRIEFVTRKITNGVAKIYLGQQDNIVLGNLNSKRDWGYSPDYVEAMWLMLQQDIPDDYIIATGKTHTIEDFLNISFERIGISDWKKYIKQDERYFRNEKNLLVGNIDKINRIGWKPKTSFRNMIYKMVDTDIEKGRNK